MRNKKIDITAAINGMLYNIPYNENITIESYFHTDNYDEYKICMVIEGVTKYLCTIYVNADGSVEIYNSVSCLVKYVFYSYESGSVVNSAIASGLTKAYYNI